MRKFADNQESSRRFKHWGHSNPLWILEGVGQYVNKQTNNMYMNKQTTVKAGFNPNSIKSFINVKTTFKNIFHNLIYIDFIIFYLQMSIKIGNVSKQGKKTT